MTLENKKAAAKKAYKEAKETYLRNRTDENWKAFIDAKIVCRLLGCII